MISFGIFPIILIQMKKWLALPAFAAFIEWLCAAISEHDKLMLILLFASLAITLIAICKRFANSNFQHSRAWLLSAIILILASLNLANSTVSSITILITGLFVDLMIGFELYQIAQKYQHFEVRVRATVNSKPESLGAEIDGIQRYILFTSSINNR